VAKNSLFQRRSIAMSLFAGFSMATQAATQRKQKSTVKLKCADTKTVTIKNISDLLSLDIYSEIGEVLFIAQGYHKPFDGGGGAFYWCEDSKVPENRGIYFRSYKSEVGRWIRFELNSEINVKHFGASGDGIADDTSAIQSAIDSLKTADDTLTGGIVSIPRGRYKISRPITINSLNSAGLPSVFLRGQGIHNTILIAAEDFIGEAILLFEKATYCRVEDIHLFGRTTIQAGMKDATGGSHLTVRRVFAQKFNNGFLMKDSFMTNFEGCRAKSCKTGFRFVGFHTSLLISNCYALNNDGPGFHFSGVVYSNMLSCGSDDNLVGYRIENSNSMTISGCGAEICRQSAFEVANADDFGNKSIITDTNIRLTSCFATDCNRSRSERGSSIHFESTRDQDRLTVDSFQEHSSTSLYSVTGTGVIALQSHSQFKSKINSVQHVNSLQNELSRQIEVDGRPVVIATLAYSEGQSSAGGTLIVQARAATADGVLSTENAIVIVFAIAAQGAQGTLVELSRLDPFLTKNPLISSCQLQSKGKQVQITAVPKSRYKGLVQFIVSGSGNFTLI
jgi:Pectate lyase superfamily protein